MNTGILNLVDISTDDGDLEDVFIRSNKKLDLIRILIIL